MPMYDFLCPECGYRFEMRAPAELQRTQCPRCDLFSVTTWAERQPSAPAFVVNGFNAKNGYAK